MGLSTTLMMVLQAMLSTADVLLLRLTAVPLLNRLPLASLRKLLLRFELALEGPRDTPASSSTHAVEVAYYTDCKQWAASILDTYIPRCRRLTQLHFGRIVSNPDAPQSFAENIGYNMTYNLVEPFKGNALHIHPSVEIFIALDGRWEIAWGADGSQSTTLEPFDLVCVPEDVRHSYKNIEPHTANNIMTILPGKASITWAPAVVAEARKHGARCTDDGVLLDFWSKGQGRANQAAEASEHASEPRAPECGAPPTPDPAAADYHIPMSDEEMARCVRRHADGRPLVVQTPEGFLRVSWHTLACGASFDARSVAGTTDVLLVVLEGAADLTCGGEFRGTAARLDAVRIPARAQADARATCATAPALTNRLPAPCTMLKVESELRGLIDKHSDSWAIGDDALLPLRSAASAEPLPRHRLALSYESVMSLLPLPQQGR